MIKGKQDFARHVRKLYVFALGKQPFANALLLYVLYFLAKLLNFG